MTVKDLKAQAVQAALAPYLDRARAAQEVMVAARRKRDLTFLDLSEQGLSAAQIAGAAGLSYQRVLAIVSEQREGTEP